MTRIDRVASALLIFLLVCFTCTIGLLPRQPSGRIAYDAALVPSRNTGLVMGASRLPDPEMSWPSFLKGTAIQKFADRISLGNDRTRTGVRQTNARSTAATPRFAMLHQRNVTLNRRRSWSLDARPSWVGSR